MTLIYEEPGAAQLSPAHKHTNPAEPQTTDKYRQFVSTTVVISVFPLASAIFIRTATVISAFQATTKFISQAVILVFLQPNTKQSSHF